MSTKTTNTLKHIANIIIAVGLLMTLLSFIFFIFNIKSKDENIVRLNNENIKLIEIAENDNLNKIKIESLIKDYTLAISDRSIKRNTFEYFFADTLTRFFLEENISKKEAYYKMKWYWKKYPKSHVYFDLDSMTYEKHNDTFKIYLPSKNKRNTKLSSQS